MPTAHAAAWDGKTRNRSGYGIISKSEDAFPAQADLQSGCYARRCESLKVSTALIWAGWRVEQRNHLLSPVSGAL